MSRSPSDTAPPSRPAAGASSRPQAGGVSWFDLLWRMPRSKKEWAATAGRWVSDYAFQTRREQLSQDHFTYDGLNKKALGEGVGRLIAAWIVYQRPEEPLSYHLLRLEALVAALDEASETPTESAVTRFLASKTALALEGYRSKTGEPLARYQVYQQEAKALLRVLPQMPARLSKTDVYLGRPFSAETLLIASYRFLTAAAVEKTVADLQAFLADWRQRPLSDEPSYYARLLASTYRQDNPAVLGETLDQWFFDYRDYLLVTLGRRERWIQKSINLASGKLPF